MSKEQSRPVNLGFIGGGFVGQVAHLANYVGNTNCRLVALCEAKPKLRAAVQAHYGFEKAYSSHQELLRDPDIDAVVCITRRPNTGPIALDVLQAGKDLLTEKPMAHTVEQGLQLCAAAAKTQRIYAVGYMRRHDAGVQAAKSLIAGVRASGELGKLNFVRAHCFGGDSYCGVKAAVTTDEPYPPNLPEWALAPSWVPQTRVAAYASFVNVFSHNINLLRYLVAEVPRVDHAHLGNGSGGVVVFDYGAFRATLEAGTTALTGWDDVIELYFDSGRIRIELQPAFLLNATAKVEIQRATAKGLAALLSWPESWAFKRQADSFVQDVAARTTPLASAADALEDLKLLEEIWRAELRRS